MDFIRDEAHALYEAQEAARDNLERIYLDDLREVLDTEAGKRVLLRWLEDAGTFATVSRGTAEDTIRAAAVSDFGKSRILEIQQASPWGLIYVMQSGFNALLKKENENGTDDT